MADAVWRGVAGSPGLALGPAFVVRTHPAEETTPGVEAARVPESTDEAELGRWRAARGRVEETYARLAERAREVAGPAEAAILEAQGMMAADPDLEEQVGGAVARGLSAEAATREAIAELLDVVGSLA